MQPQSFHASPAGGGEYADALAPGAYDLVTTFDCLHDMGDPVGAARQIRSALGAHAGPARIAEAVAEAGFTHFRCVAETPFNHVTRSGRDRPE